VSRSYDALSQTHQRGELPAGHNLEIDGTKSPPLIDRRHAHHHTSAGGGTEVHTEEEESSGMLLQPETPPITEEQLIRELQGIYPGLVMVERQCEEFGRELSQSPNELNDLEWQALSTLHRTLLYEHHDFFWLPSTHPQALC
jgi:hypothetical protein